jgi:hypothetical protein
MMYKLFIAGIYRPKFGAYQMTKEITKFDDIIDLRDVIARFEELEAERDVLSDAYDEAEEGTQAEVITRSALNDWRQGDVGAEFDCLFQLLSDCEGNGGDEEWRGAWYPGMIIRCTHFKEYAQELAEDCGMIQANAKWPHTCIDWDQAARELLTDYTTISFDGVDYHCR